jgi:DNA-binding cell septation regulator SpoVG
MTTDAEKISHVRVSPDPNPLSGVLAFCSFTYDGALSVTGVRLVRNARGEIIAAFPGRLVTFPCPQCGSKNSYSANYCNRCGTDLPHRPLPEDASGRPHRRQEDCFPISRPARQAIEDALIAAYQAAVRQEGQ